jgi:hypothetical protein
MPDRFKYASPKEYASPGLDMSRPDERIGRSLWPNVAAIIGRRLNQRRTLRRPIIAAKLPAKK